MIKFQGLPVGECRRYMLRRESKAGLFGGIFAAMLFAIPAIILTFTYHWIFAICIPLLIAVALMAGMPPSKKSYGLVLPFSVSINVQEEIIVSQGEKFCDECQFSEVVKVLDMGDWYHVFCSHRAGRIVCQKDLLVTGTIEEFEALFADKIVRVPQKQKG